MAHIRVYPHNNLLNLAHYHREVINDKEAEGEEYALDFDCLSCVLSLGLAVEALVNFVGHRRCSEWRERRPFRQKIEEVCNAANLEFNVSIEPFCTIWELKETRDHTVHGQPIETVISAQSREEIREELAPPWQRFLTSEYINHAYRMVKDFQHALFEGAEIELGDSLTSYIAAGRET